MNKGGIRLYYKNQEELSYALRDYIDDYFEGNIEDEDLEEKIYRGEITDGKTIAAILAYARKYDVK